MTQKRFLHLGYDDKFYPGSINYYSHIKGISNSFVLFVNGENRPIQYVKVTEAIHVIRDRNALALELKKNDYDVLFVHSLSYHFWDFIGLVPPEVTIIWQSYGYDIYTPGPFGVDYKLIQLNSILPITAKALRQSIPLSKSLRNELIHLFLNLKWRWYGRKIIERINYIQPVFHFEYELLKELPYFKAREYYPPHYNPRWQNYSDEPKQMAQGAIQLGNSASEYGNHLDVWEKIKSYIPNNQEIIMPLSYGDSNYANYVKSIILESHENTTVLERFIPIEDYFSIVRRSSYFVHGAMRQHAMSNVYNAIAEGHKVFLFDNSIIYRYLTGIGCVVFPIEGIDEKSFCTPLTKAEHNQNILALQRKIKKRREKGALIFNTILNL